MSEHSSALPAAVPVRRSRLRDVLSQSTTIITPASAAAERFADNDLAGARTRRSC